MRDNQLILGASSPQARAPVNRRSTASSFADTGALRSIVKPEKSRHPVLVCASIRRLLLARRGAGALSATLKEVAEKTDNCCRT